MNGAIIGRLCGVGLLVLTATGPSSGVTLFHRPIVRVGANQSNNWSGYNQGSLERGGVQFHSVSGTWTVMWIAATRGGRSVAIVKSACTASPSRS